MEITLKVEYRLTTDDEQRFYCKEKIPTIAGTYSGTVAIYGGGKEMWDDYSRLHELMAGEKYDKLATNVAAMFLPNIQHMYSLHFKQISIIKKWRDVEYAEAYSRTPPIVHGSKEWEGIDYVWYLAMRSSTSGFVMINLAYLLGYRKFILCGVPMDDSGYFYKPMFNPTFNDNLRQKEILAVKELFGDNVKSMSGNTKKILGEPDIEWIKEAQHAQQI